MAKFVRELPVLFNFLDMCQVWNCVANSDIVKHALISSIMDYYEK